MTSLRIVIVKKLFSLLTVLSIILGVSLTAHAYQYGYGLAAIDLGSLGVSYNDDSQSAGVSSLGYYGSAGYAAPYSSIRLRK